VTWVWSNMTQSWFHSRRQQQRVELNLQNLGREEARPGQKEGTKMILPGHLNTLLSIFPPNHVLVVDLRSPTEFERSHIHGAVNLRVPASFVGHNFDMLGSAFTDDYSRRNFARWRDAKCIVFYDKRIDFSWECPTADVFYEHLRRRGWTGQCYTPKGLYREFALSFLKYIAGNKMTQEAKEYVDSLRERSAASQVSSRRTEQCHCAQLTEK